MHCWIPRRCPENSFSAPFLSSCFSLGGEQRSKGSQGINLHLRSYQVLEWRALHMRCRIVQLMTRVSGIGHDYGGALGRCVCMNILERESVNSWVRAGMRVWFPWGSPRGRGTSGRRCSTGDWQNLGAGGTCPGKKRRVKGAKLDLSGSACCLVPLLQVAPSSHSMRTYPHILPSSVIGRSRTSVEWLKEQTWMSKGGTGQGCSPPQWPDTVVYGRCSEAQAALPEPHDTFCLLTALTLLLTMHGLPQ